VYFTSLFAWGALEGTPTLLDAGFSEVRWRSRGEVATIAAWKRTFQIAQDFTCLLDSVCSNRGIVLARIAVLVAFLA
jgi:hypothetical protein